LKSWERIYSRRDLISDFSAAEGDTIDLSALGFSGFGDGHDGTLKVSVNAAGDKVINSLTRDDQEIVGTAKADVLVGNYARDEILGFEGNDSINGGAGNDSMAGGKGIDTLTGGAGRDDFVFYNIGESFRTATEDHSDVITDYESGDILYALDLGFTKLGDGTNGTLKLDYDSCKNQTHLHSLEANNQGQFFQVTLAGEHKTVSIALDGLYVDEQPIQIAGANPTDPAPV
jgi:Ca2+-binding RTX toxin-like protein